MAQFEVADMLGSLVLVLLLVCRGSIGLNTQSSGDQKRRMHWSQIAMTQLT